MTSVVESRLSNLKNVNKNNDFLFFNYWHTDCHQVNKFIKIY